MTMLLRRNVSLVSGLQWTGDNPDVFAHLITRDIIRIGTTGDLWLLTGPGGAMGWKQFPAGTWVLDYTTANGYHFEAVHPSVLDNEYVICPTDVARTLADLCYDRTPPTELVAGAVEGEDELRTWRIIEGRLVPAPELDTIVTGPAPAVDPDQRPGEFHGQPVSEGIPEAPAPYDAMAAYQEMYRQGEVAEPALEVEDVGGILVVKPSVPREGTAGIPSEIPSEAFGPNSSMMGEMAGKGLPTEVDKAVMAAAEQPLTCVDCGKELQNVAGLKSHRRAKHGKAA